MATYTITAENAVAAGVSATLLRIGFGEPAQNDAIVADAVKALAENHLQGGELVLLNGPASLPAACAIAHGVGHLYSAVGVFDPKLAGYVVSICHGGAFTVGQIILATDVAAAE
ncbi:MAG: CRISPR-associated protein Csx3 [Candidatus Berkelbacteria bacterium]